MCTQLQLFVPPRILVTSPMQLWNSKWAWEASHCLPQQLEITNGRTSLYSSKYYNLHHLAKPGCCNSSLDNGVRKQMNLAQWFSNQTRQNHKAYVSHTITYLDSASIYCHWIIQWPYIVGSCNKMGPKASKTRLQGTKLTSSQIALVVAGHGNNHSKWALQFITMSS